MSHTSIEKVVSKDSLVDALANANLRIDILTHQIVKLTDKLLKVEMCARDRIEALEERVFKMQKEEKEKEEKPYNTYTMKTKTHGTITVKNTSLEEEVHSLNTYDILRFFPKGEDFKEYYLYTAVVWEGALVELQRQKVFVSVEDWLESIPVCSENGILTKNIDPCMVEYWKCPDDKPFALWTHGEQKFRRNKWNDLYAIDLHNPLNNPIYYGIYYPGEGILRHTQPI